MLNKTLNSYLKNTNLNQVNKVIDSLNVVSDEIIKDVFMEGGEPPRNRIRKVIFKDYTGLSLSEKLSIVGRLIGRSKRICEEDIYQCMIDLNDSKQKITIAKLAKLLKCTTRTIYRNMGNQLKQEKEILNKEL